MLQISQIDTIARGKDLLKTPLKMNKITRVSYFGLILLFFSGWVLGSESFYKEPQLFPLNHPNEKTRSQMIDRFGPVGMSVELRLPAFQMIVGKIEEGSPAQMSGKLKTGQKIESINGQTLKDIDPRVQLAKIITEAEGKDGKIIFEISSDDKNSPDEVVVEIPVLGTYSASWPVNCKKSDLIVRNMANWVKEHGAYNLDTQGWSSLNGFGMLFLLSTGDESDLSHVRGWIEKVIDQYKGEDKILLKPWVFGSAAIPLAEYFLRTGDERILPVIEKIAHHACGTMYNGGWSGRGGLVFGYMNGGHMNAAGVHVPTFLLLAKECGVEVDEKILKASLKHLYRFAGKGSLAYGDGFPETYFIDNGKTGALAFAMAAAASLTPKGESSVYAKARDISALRGFYGTNYMLTGHTGGGIGEVWRGPAMGFLHQKEKEKYRSFMDGRQWHLELSRRYDGSFGILNGSSRYDKPSTWGQMMALQYTIPRKTLRLSGRERSKWSKPYLLPETPWGTKEDQDFCELRPAKLSNGKEPIFDNSLEKGTINGIERLFRDAEDTKQLAVDYAHHPDHEVRREIGSGYMKRNEQDKIVVSLLKHRDARVRRSALSVIHSKHKGVHVLPPERISEEMTAIVLGMINDPMESWWCVENALRAASLLPKEKVLPHLDRLLYFLTHEEWWLQHAAMIALAPFSVDEQTYKKVLPKMKEMMVANTHAPATGSMSEFTRLLPTASPKVQRAALSIFKEAYASFPKELLPPAGSEAADVLKGDMGKYVLPVSLKYIANHMMKIPGGFGELFKVAKVRFPEQALPYQQNYLWADHSKFAPDVRKAIQAVFMNQLVPEYVTRNFGALNLEMSKGGNPFCRLEELALRYHKAGINDYDWKNFGPDRNEMTWSYYNFDPDEKKPWSPGGDRSRKINFPEGMAKWSSLEFDAKKAGWKIGQAPFGQSDGLLRTGPPMSRYTSCDNPVCRCSDPMKTLWEKEVLMIKGRFKFPPMQKGHSYRLLFGGASHVGMGNGPRVFINGKEMVNGKAKIRRGHGGRPRGKLLSPAMAKVFSGKEVELSAIGHLNLHHRTKKMHSFLTVWMEEMKNPPVTRELAWEGLSQIPMRSTSWQQAQATDMAEIISEEGLYRFDGRFISNPKVIGTWSPLGVVSEIESFNSESVLEGGRPRYGSITFKEKGFTSLSTHYWSSDTLMEVSGGKSGKPLALKMVTKMIKDKSYLFIEVGDFTYYHERQTYKQPRRWKSPWYVFVKK